MSFYRDSPQAKANKLAKEKTIVVVGCSQSGTTMLAGVLIALGVPMVHKRYLPYKLEDLDITENLYNEKKLKKEIELRNSLYPVWGFKSPGSWRIIPFLSKNLRTPIYILMMKNPLNVTYRRFGANNRRIIEKVANTLHIYDKDIQGIIKTKEDCLIFSYTQAAVSPRNFVLELIDVLGLEANYKDINTAMGIIYNDLQGNPWLSQ